MHPTSCTIRQRRSAFLAVCALAVPLLAGAAPALLSGVDEVQRLDTQGGKFAGSCTQEGALHVEPYSARYVFLGR